MNNRALYITINIQWVNKIKNFIVPDPTISTRISELIVAPKVQPSKVSSVRPLACADTLLLVPDSLKIQLCVKNVN